MVEHPARMDRYRQMRRLHLVSLEGGGAGLDRLEPVDAGVVRARAPEPAELRIERQIVAPIARVVVAAVRVRLPDLDHGVRHDIAGAVEDPALRPDALTGPVRGR